MAFEGAWSTKYFGSSGGVKASICTSWISGAAGLTESRGTSQKRGLQMFYILYPVFILLLVHGSREIALSSRLC
jgi:hypothetical protein